MAFCLLSFLASLMAYIPPHRRRSDSRSSSSGPSSPSASPSTSSPATATATAVATSTSPFPATATSTSTSSATTHLGVPRHRHTENPGLSSNPSSPATPAHQTLIHSSSSSSPSSPATSAHRSRRSSSDFCTIYRWFPTSGLLGFQLAAHSIEQEAHLLTVPDRADPDERFWFITSRRICEEMMGLLPTIRDMGKMAITVCIGKVLWHGSVNGCSNTLRRVDAESGDRRLSRKTFYSNIPEQHIGFFENINMENIGFQFSSTKVVVTMRILDRFLNSVMICKCSVSGGELKVLKTKQQHERHLVVDLSCLNKDLDMRLMLSTTASYGSSNYANDFLNKLVKGASLDPNIKGGVKWPLGACLFDDYRYQLTEVRHTMFQCYKSETMTLSRGISNRYDYRSCSGEISYKVTVKLTPLTRQLEEDQPSQLEAMLQQGLRRIYENFDR